MINIFIFVWVNLMLIAGFIFDDLVISLRTPEGFILSMSTIMFLEHLTVKSIASDRKKTLWI
ncbi:MAG: hypothetical protein NTV36_00495 [Candidatus Staskawiczbacteria bacterium]|nr:hypothetical protein [Candidatus Staskawiczbacteria bacterium]